ncbi:MAG: spore coat protein [Bacilli bacterium]|nr:spore coat protein [Bacilli bacterium]
MARSDNDIQSREIITSAVCGKGSKYSQTTYTLRPANRPTTIGGCWVMNHSCEAELAGDYVEVHGRFDLNVWYSYNGNSETAVAKDTVSYVEQIPLRDLDPLCTKEGMEVAVRILQQPNTLDAVVIDGGSDILVRVEKELMVEAIGKTKVYVLVCDPPSDKDEDDGLDLMTVEEDDFEV